ncbi:MAG: alpha/beta hydrolase [Flavobacteriales bacterium]|nr:alpha/beta hydrolase [Flavobacteriales bacterium]
MRYARNIAYWGTFIVGLCLTLASCKKMNLDGLAFPRQTLDEYELEDYDNVQLVSMTSVDEESGEEYTIYGAYIGDISSIATDTVILYCHGQSRHMDAYWTRVDLLAHVAGHHHYGVFMMDYRGYGMSEGTPTERGLYEDVDASISWLRSQGVEGGRTFYYGFSLGCIPVIDRAAYREDFKPAKIMLESPLSSVENLAQSSLILDVDPQFMTTLEFNNVEKIKDVDVPLLWMHGVEDDYIAITNGEMIYENHSGGYKEAIRVEGAGHGDVPVVLKANPYIEIIENFMKH